MTHSRIASFLVLSAFLVLSTLVAPASAEARVQCGAYTTREYQAEIDPAAQIFVGELIASVPRDDVPADERGVSGSDLTFRVVEAIRGVAVGDTVQVYWRGFSEPRGGRAGGCRVPEMGEGTSRFLVIAQRDEGQLTVANQTTSQQVNASRRDLVRRVRRIANRRR